ncbi:helix-turn-helix transcriptional regulator [Fulvivirga sp. M361]|uniref:helix-turn-helix domain-containing protein n=1 Tax=Fulvivirga sp. M361 TaxID=2594266 RepID=UPI00117B1110|nr:AraC family transcriptional regulator [Fulvivirga sp. M361]TRX60143.1 helix-turn-helix transcriptional regulator [Fulvivirga sp. M361]
MIKAVLEPVSHDPNQSFHFGIYDESSFESPWHFHPQWELTYIVNSSGIRSVGNSIRSYQTGELVLLGQKLPHCWKSNESENERARSIFIQFDEQLLGDHWMQKEEFSTIRQMLLESKYGLLFDRDTARRAGSVLEGMKLLTPMHRLLKVVELLYELSVTKYELLSLGAHFDTNEVVSKRIGSIISFVAEHYRTKITSDQLAELVFLTPVSFSKFFKRTFNKTFTVYLNEYRVSKACELLKRSDISVESIAYQSGYQNLSFFHRQFKAITRRSPAEYRKHFDTVQ